MSTSIVAVSNLELLLSLNQARKFMTSAWMIREALSYRIAFLFSDKSLLTVSGENEIWLQADASAGVKPDSKWITKSSHDEFMLVSDSETVTDVLLSEIEQRGFPKLILPWEDWERVEDSLRESEEEDVELLIESFNKQILSGSSEYMWSAHEFTYGEDCLPKDCDYARFESFMDDLEEANWIVIWDECCGTCASGNIRSERESDPTKIDSPSFVIYGQNADHYFFPDGSIHNYMFMVDENGNGLELELASKYGFTYAPEGSIEGLYLLNPA